LIIKKETFSIEDCECCHIFPNQPQERESLCKLKIVRESQEDWSHNTLYLKFKLLNILKGKSHNLQEAIYSKCNIKNLQMKKEKDIEDMLN